MLKPAPDQRTLIEDSIAHSLKAHAAMLAGDMDNTLLVHTTAATAQANAPAAAG